MLDRIITQASTVKPGRALATVALLPFYLVGLLAGAAVMLAVLIWVAGVEGYQTIRPKGKK